MTFEIELNGRTRSVAVERVAASPHHFRVTVDGVVRLVDAVRVDEGMLSLILSDGDGASHQIGLTGGKMPGEQTVLLPDGTSLNVIVNGRRARRSSDTAGAAGEQRVLAPMPGKVLRVLVRVGDEVAVRQPLVVVEAMKMENELGSPKAGRVKEVSVQEGQSVEAGRLLLVVD
jgi:acetyl/propionyl-CoA carboxylase alpha subunit